MKSKIIWLSLRAFAMACILTGCNSPEKKMEEVQTSDSIRQNVVIDTTSVKQDWEKFKADASEKIKANEDTLDAWKMELNKAGKKMKAKNEQRIAELRKKNEQMKKKLEEYKEEGKEKWEKFKTDFKNEMDTLALRMKEITK